VSTFYRPNIAVPAGPKTTTPASFILTAAGTVQSTAQTYETNGYRLLGESDFQNLTAAPLRNEALAYAQQVGATLVIYAVEPIGQVQPVTKTVLDQSGHYITTNTTTKVEGNSNSGSGPSDLPDGMNSEMRQFESANGIGSASDSSDGGGPPPKPLRAQLLSRLDITARWFPRLSREHSTISLFWSGKIARDSQLQPALGVTRAQRHPALWHEPT
jgi:hypothetical protein